MLKFDCSNIQDMENLIEKLRKIQPSEVAILGNGVSLLDVDRKELDNIFTIGVNHIEQYYIPNVLLWVDEFKERLGSIHTGKAPLKVCRAKSFHSDIPQFIKFLSDKYEPYGHEWTGKLKKVGCTLTALHLAMICFKDIYIVGSDFSEDAHFYDYLEDAVYKGNNDASRNVNFKDTTRCNFQHYRQAIKANKKCNMYFTTNRESKFFPIYDLYEKSERFNYA